MKPGFDGRDALADADVQASAAHLVEHTQLFEEPERVVERQQIHERADAQALRSAGNHREVDVGRGREAERGRVMLGHVIAVEAQPVVEFGQRQALCEKRSGIARAAVDVIENADFKRLRHAVHYRQTFPV